MDKKIDTLKALMAAEQWEKAIKFAAKFPRRGNERDAILSASAALLSPSQQAGRGDWLTA